MDGGDSEKLVIKFQGASYDLTEFKHKHPGGVNTLKGFKPGDDIMNRFAQAPPHSSAALYLLKEYKIQDNLNKSSDESVPHSSSNGHANGVIRNGHANGTANGHANGLLHGDVKRDTSEPNNNDLNYQIDESMEHLVDWTKAILPQIGKLGKNYHEWVNKPVDREMRLFTPNYLEMLTKTPWWLIPLFWIPTIFYLLKISIESALDDELTFTQLGSKVVYGVILWTIIEYTLHRWLFHIDTSNAGQILCTFHFLIHGLHHKVPFDPYRLVFPPVPAVILASIIYTPLSFVIAHPMLVLCGGLIGYVIYDLTHFYLHYGSPSGGSHLYHMKRYHYQHHFVHHDKGFGISSPIWDFIFDTRIILRKLKYVLKW